MMYRFGKPRLPGSMYGMLPRLIVLAGYERCKDHADEASGSKQ